MYICIYVQTGVWIDIDKVQESIHVEYHMSVKGLSIMAPISE